MTFMNDTGNIKQFQLVEYINGNCDDDHVMSKISIVLRRDKIEAPYYMVTKIKLSNCIDRPDNGLIHAMDMFTHHRRHNLTMDEFNDIKSLIKDKNHESDLVKITEKDEQLQLVLMSRNDGEFDFIFNEYKNLFDKIDSLVD